MYVAYSLDHQTRYALPGATDDDKSDATAIGPDEARLLAGEKRLRCADERCEAFPFYRQGQSASGVRGHWYHPAGTAEGCSAGHDGEGAWHRFVTRDLLGLAMAREHQVPGARIDVVVKNSRKGALVAIEAQHSTIDYSTVLGRNGCHSAGGMCSTLWIIDGDAALPDVDKAQWATPGEPWPSLEVHDGARATGIRTPWVIDVLRACADTESMYGCTVGLLVETATGHVLRFVDRVSIEDVDGQVVALVSEWTEPIPERVIRPWAGGPDSRLHDEVGMQRLASAWQRRIKMSTRRYWAKATPDEAFVRVVFSEQHTGNRTLGEELGLEWSRRSSPFSDGTPAGVGHLFGPLTFAVRSWLERLQILSAAS